MSRTYHLEPTIFFLSMSELNNSKYFTLPANKIAGQYNMGSSGVFITERIFSSKGYTDFVHEWCHFLNHNNSFEQNIGESDDERIATSFEDYYQRNHPYVQQ